MPISAAPAKFREPILEPEFPMSRAEVFEAYKARYKLEREAKGLYAGSPAELATARERVSAYEQARKAHQPKLEAYWRELRALQKRRRLPAREERPEVIAAAKRHLDEAKTAREAEREAGQTVHTIAYHLKQANITRAQESKGGKAYADMTAEEKKTYKEARKRGETIPEAALTAVTPKLPMITVDDKEVHDIDKIAKDVILRAVFVKEVKGGRDILAEHYKARRVRAKWEKEIAAGGIEVTIEGETRLISAEDATRIKEETPGLHKILVEKGYDAYVAAVNAYNFEVQQSLRAQHKFEKAHTELPDGNWVENKWLARLKKDDPTGHFVLTTRGIEAAEARVKASETAITTLKPYTDKEGSVDGAAYLREYPGDRQTLKDAGFNPAQIVDWEKWNEARGKVVLWSGEIELQGEAFKERVTQLMIERPQFAQWQAEQLVRVQFRREGKELKPSPDLPQRIKLAQVHYNSLSPEEKANLKKQWKALPVELAELVVPGVYVARHWTTLTTKDKIVNIGIDTAAVLLAVGLFKLAGVGVRALSGTTKVVRLAAKAGKVGATLQQTTKAFATYQKVGKMGSKLWIKHANAVTKAQQASMKADRILLAALQRLQAISPKQLRQIAKVSGLREIDKAVMAVTKAQRDLAKAWKALGKLKYYADPKTAKQIAANEKYLRALARVEQTQIKLQLALRNAGSVLQPRYTPSPDAPEFKGYRVKYEFTLEKKPTIKPATPKVTQTMESYLTGEVKPLKKKVIVAEKERFAPWTMKMKAAYAKAKAKPRPEPKVPTVTEFKRQIAAAFKKVPREAAVVIPSEAWGRMTYAQIAKYYGIEELVDADARAVEKYLIRQGILMAITPANRADIREIIRAGVQAQIRAMQRALTASQTKALVQEAVSTRVRAVPAFATAVKPLTKQIVRTVTKTITTTVTPLRVTLPILKVLPPILLRVPIPLLNKEEAKKRIARVAGALCWRQGTVRKAGKRVSVWYVILAPYKSRKDAFMMHEPPPGAKIVKGKRSAYNTIQQLTGKPPKFVLTLDLGIQDIHIDDPAIGAGKPRAIKYVPDPFQRTTSMIDLRKRRTSRRSGKKPRKQPSPQLSTSGVRV